MWAGPLLVNETGRWQACCLTGCSLYRSLQNPRPFHLAGRPKLGPYACLRGHWWHPTPSSKGRRHGQGPNNSQLVRTLRLRWTSVHRHTHALRVKPNTWHLSTRRTQSAHVKPLCQAFLWASEGDDANTPGDECILSLKRRVSFRSCRLRSGAGREENLFAHGTSDI